MTIKFLKESINLINALNKESNNYALKIGYSYVSYYDNSIVKKLTFSNEDFFEDYRLAYNVYVFKNKLDLTKDYINKHDFDTAEKTFSHGIFYNCSTGLEVTVNYEINLEDYFNKLNKIINII